MCKPDTIPVMMDLFDRNLDDPSDQPLARRMRPRSIEEFAGQTHVLGEGRPLWRIINARFLTSLILFGPPGTGKTAMAHLLAERFDAEFVELNAVTSGIADIRRVSSEATDRMKHHGRKTLLFIDEIHRFNKSQQDALLPDVEAGRLILLGATTHNPSFYITRALNSRATLIEFKSLSRDELISLLETALADPEKGLGARNITADRGALEGLADFSDGDARRALTSLEVLAAGMKDDEKMGVEDLEKGLGRKALLYDRDEDSHYDAASAFIKSMRGGDPNAAVYYLARMLEGGEDPRFLARRMAIFASEDIGNADPRALVLATSAHAAAEFVGMPEARIILSQCATYLASAPKSNAAYVAVDSALEDVRSGRLLDVPISLKGTGYGGARERGHGADYKYPHAYGGFVKQEYLKENRSYYEPTDSGEEKRIKERLKTWWGEWPRKSSDEQ